MRSPRFIARPHYSAIIAPPHLPAKPLKPIMAAISGSRPPSSSPPAPPAAPFSRSSFCARDACGVRVSRGLRDGAAKGARLFLQLALSPKPPLLLLLRLRPAHARLKACDSHESHVSNRSGTAGAPASRANALGCTGAASSRFRLCSSNLACTSSSELRSTRIDMPSARISARRASAPSPRRTPQEEGAHAFCR